MTGEGPVTGSQALSHPGPDEQEGRITGSQPLSPTGLGVGVGETVRQVCDSGYRTRRMFRDVAIDGKFLNVQKCIVFTSRGSVLQQLAGQARSVIMADRVRFEVGGFSRLSRVALTNYSALSEVSAGAIWAAPSCRVVRATRSVRAPAVT